MNRHLVFRDRWLVPLTLFVSLTAFVLAGAVGSRDQTFMPSTERAWLWGAVGGGIVWGVLALPGVLLAVRGTRWLSLVPLGSFLLLASTTTLVALRNLPFSVLASSETIGVSLTALFVGLPLVVVWHHGRSNASLRFGPELVVATMLAVAAFAALDQALQAGGHHLSWAFAVAASAFAIGWDARSIRRVAIAVAILFVMQASWLLLLRDQVLTGGGWPVGFSAWSETALHAGGGAEAAMLVALMIQPVARRLGAFRSPSVVATSA